MPAFYEIWAKHDPDRADVWLRMAENARWLLQRAPHPVTGLYPEVITYAGTPSPRFNNYIATTSRTLLNLTLDYLWTNQESWIVDQNEHILDFFLAQGVDNYAAEYTTAGMPLTTYNSAAHRSLVALAAGTTSSSHYDVFLEVLLKEPIPMGVYRYYDGMLYMLSLMVLSGQMTPG
jgi:oligosaccharide reducing-end xylanase